MERGATGGPRKVVVVGAGMVGLATAWWLQESGASVTVLDRLDVAAGASEGNAGWLTPGMVTPLPEAGVLRYGLGAVLSPSSPVYVPLALDGRLFQFLAGFVRNCTGRRWARAMRALTGLNRGALTSFESLRAGGVAEPLREASPFIAAFRSERDSADLARELTHIHSSGQKIDFEILSGEAAKAATPALSEQITVAIRIHGQQYVDPGAYVRSLAASVRERGGLILADRLVEEIAADDHGVVVGATNGERHVAGAAVLATGAWLGRLGRRHGIRMPVQAGRGYSFSVPIEHRAAGPIYFPAQRVACTPLGERLRVAGMMEFRRPEAILDERRIQAIVEAARPLLRGVDLDDRRDEWVGSRPCTTDGIPLIGATRTPGVFVAGGHGMWGMTLGPITGQLLSKMIMSREVPSELRAFDPLR